MKHVTRGPRFLLISRSRGRIFKTHLRLFSLFLYPGRKVESGCGSNWFGKSVGFGKRCVFLRHPAPKNPLSKNHLAKGSNEHEGWQTILLYLYEKKDCIVDWVIGGDDFLPKSKLRVFLDSKHLLLSILWLKPFASFFPLDFFFPRKDALRTFPSKKAVFSGSLATIPMMDSHGILWDNWILWDG